jgi:hypothetical protein
LSSGIWSGSAQLPSGVVSGSSQVSFSGLSGIPVGLVSGSSQIIYGSLTGIPSGIVSGSSQVITLLPTGTVSGSSQVLAGTTIHSGSFFNGISVVSGSSQISFGGITGVPSGLVSGSSQISFGGITGVPSGLVSGSSQITLTSTQITTGLGYTPYNSTNPNGYTTNTGTVTSVGGTGTVSGLSLSGTVTTSGNLTLGGTLTLTSTQITTGLGYTPYNSTNPNGYITGISFANVSSKPTTLSGYGITDAWQAGGSWGADLTSNGFTRQIGLAYVGGEFAILTTNSQISTLIDGSYFAGEQGGFYSMNSANNYSSRVGFNRDGSGNAAFNCSVVPTSNNAFNLGSTTLGWANIYTNDLHLSNMNKPEGNDIDGTSGTWTIQEGAENLYIINNRNNKKFKISLEEIL